MPNCQYQFPNTSKTHKKGDICNSYIRKKGSSYCWRHKDQVDLQENKETDEVKNDLEFIQLENSQ